jgi:16S rRNA (guanine527-N7)-methyltransferase
MNTTIYQSLDNILKLPVMATLGLALTPDAKVNLVRHIDIVRKWNDYASLVSPGDVERLVEHHVMDSLSLVPIIRSRSPSAVSLLDIGSGGGFPAIPIKICLPELQVALVERSSRKAGILRRLVAALGLRDTEVFEADFPGQVEKGPVDLITARAVEKPEKILKGVASFMSAGTLFLCQTPRLPSRFSDEFHVERIRDEWNDAGCRRGVLYAITRRAN